MSINAVTKNEDKKKGLQETIKVGNIKFSTKYEGSAQRITFVYSGKNRRNNKKQQYEKLY